MDAEIQKRYSEGSSARKLAKEYGVSRLYVMRLIRPSVYQKEKTNDKT